MNLLIDTQIALWVVTDDARLGRNAKAQIGRRGAKIHVSAVSIWEIAIKHALGTRRRDPVLISGRGARARFEEAGMTILPVTAAHAAAVDDLPAVHGHNDPFDRMLVAQALTEPMRLLTRDARLREYGELVVPA